MRSNQPRALPVLSGQSLRLCLGVLAVLTMSHRAAAQSVYVGASAIADVVRFSGSQGSLAGGGGGGEAFGGAIRVGSALGDRWGIDIELARSGEIDTDFNYGFPVPLRAELVTGSVTGGVTGGVLPRQPTAQFFPFPFYDLSTSLQLSTVSATLWARQSLGRRSQIMYFGGVAFSRAVREQHIQLQGANPIVGGALFPPIFPRFDNKHVSYGAGPVVGVDLRIAMTEHVRFVPGLRLLLVDADGLSGWITRPAVGLQWVF